MLSTYRNCCRSISNNSTLFICCLFCHIRSARDSHLKLNNIYIKGVVTILCCRRVVDISSLLSTAVEAFLIIRPFLFVVCSAKLDQQVTHTFNGKGKLFSYALVINLSVLLYLLDIYTFDPTLKVKWRTD